MDIKSHLLFLADKYENKDFLKDDPSRYMHEFQEQKEQEIVAFLAANLAFGRREQILKHIEWILEKINTKPSEWILNESYKDVFFYENTSFYRMYSYRSMRIFFDDMRKILMESDTLGNHFKLKWEKRSYNDLFLFQVMSKEFSHDCNLIAHSKNSAAKKLNMFLRWMVRDNSPVDLGIWKWYNKSELLLPLDTHVMQQATKFNLINKSSSNKVKSANLKTAIELTEKMKEIFGDDPVRGDFALFGLGVNS